MKSILAIAVVSLLVFSTGTVSAYVVDHNSTNITQIPESAINAAKSTLHIAYGHTSHGSQLTTGMTGLVAFANGGGLGLALPHDIFAYNNGGTGGALDLHDYAMGGDCGYYPQWVNNTRDYLASHPDTNVIIWSWCGQVSGISEQDMIDEYLAPMTQLELDYPDVTFVYMTGHSDGSGESGNLHIRNQQIRNYCITHNKVLYDFYDIETYDPDNNYFGDKRVNDACDYDSDNNGSRDANWATAWQASHTEDTDWYDCTSAHSEPLNANRKAYAAWWLWARIAGWNGGTGADTEDPTIPQNLNAVASSHSQIDLSWNASTDNVAVTGYKVFRDGSQIATRATTTYNDTGLAASSTHSYTVLAYDAAGNESAQSTSASVTTLPPSGDTEAPTIPQSLNATVISATQVDLSWDDSSDNTAVTGYKVYYKQGSMSTPLDGTGANEGSSPIDVGNVVTTTVTGLTRDTSYYFAVTAYDAAGNESAYSDIVSNQWMPELLAPQNGETDVQITSPGVRFQWSTIADTTYTLYYGTDPTLGAGLVPPGNGSSSGNRTPLTATALLLSLLLLLTATTTRIRYRYVLLTLGAAIALTACGSSGGSGSSSASVHSVDKGASDYHQTTDLSAGTTYYWKVVATDNSDPSVTYSSATYHFTTEN